MPYIIHTVTCIKLCRMRINLTLPYVMMDIVMTSLTNHGPWMKMGWHRYDWKEGEGEKLEEKKVAFSLWLLIWLLNHYIVKRFSVSSLRICCFLWFTFTWQNMQKPGLHKTFIYIFSFSCKKALSRPQSKKLSKATVVHYETFFFAFKHSEIFKCHLKSNLKPLKANKCLAFTVHVLLSTESQKTIN